MESKPRPDVGLPQPEMPAIRLREEKVRRTNRWLLGAVAVLAAAVVALAVALIVQVNRDEAPAPAAPTPAGLADSATVALVDEFVTATSAMDSTNVESTVADLFLPDAALYAPTLQEPERFASNEGRAAIQGMYEWLLGQTSLAVERVSPVIQAGNHVAFMVNDLGALDHTWIQIWRDGRIAKMWILIP